MPLRRRVWAGVTRRCDYLVSTVVAAGMAQTWFRPGRHTAAGDVAPFVRDSLAASLTDLWGYHLTAAGSPSYEIARIFDVVAIEAASLVGLGGAGAQRAFYTLAAMIAAVGGTYLAGAFTERRAVRAAAGVFAVANPYWLVLIPNHIFLLAVAAGSLAAGVAVRAARGQPPPVAVVALGSTLLAPLAVNPPLLAVMGCWGVLLLAGARLFGGSGGWSRVLGYSARAVPWVVLVNLFWMVPSAITISASSTSVVAEVSADAWAWSHAQNTVPNVLSLTAHWGWSFPDMYYPYAPRLDGVWFNWMRFAVPVLAASAVILTRGAQRRVAAAALFIVVVAGFAGKGLHPPLAQVNRWLYDHVPGMWLLREPMSKVGWMVVIAYLVASVVAADRLLDLASRRDRRRSPPAMVPVMVLAAALAYVHPLWNGEAIPAQRVRLPGSYVEIPPAWELLAETADGLDDGGTVLVLPIAGFYQMGHVWGYYGVERVPGQLMTRRTLHLSSGGYFGGPPAYQAAVHLLQSALLAGDAAEAGRLFEALGVSSVIVRHDYVPDLSQGDLADPVLLDSALSRVEDARRVLSTGVGNLWQVGPARPRVHLTADLVETRSPAGPEGMARALAATRRGSVLLPAGAVDPAEKEAVAWVIEEAEATIHLERRSDVVVSIEDRALPSWRFAPTPEGVEVTALHQLTVDGEARLWADPIRLSMGGTPVVMSVEGRIASLDRAVVLPAPPGAEVGLYATVGRTRLAGPVDPVVGDCNAYDARTPEQAGLAAETIPGGIRLAAAAHAACVRYALPEGEAAILTIGVEATRRSGSPPRLCVYFTASSKCVADAELGGATGRLSVVVPAHPGLELYLYADEPGAGSADAATVSEYSHPTIEVHEVTKTFGLPELPETIALPGLDAGSHVIGTSTATAGTAAGLSRLSGLEDCHRHSDRTPEEAGLALGRPDPDTVRLQARAHSACVWIPLGRPDFGAYTLSLDLRGLSGALPRVCVWQAGSDRCVELPPLPRGPGWQPYVATVHPDPSAGELRLYLYADAPPQQVDVETVVEYRHVVWSPSLPWTLVATSQPGPVPSVRHTTVVSTPSEEVVRLPAEMPSGPVVVVLNDTFDPRWELTGVPGARHLEVDGWANGWLFDEGTAVAGSEITLAYAPAAWARLAGLLSAATAAAAIVYLTTGAVRRRGRTNFLMQARRRA